MPNMSSEKMSLKRQTEAHARERIVKTTLPRHKQYQAGAGCLMPLPKVRRSTGYSEDAQAIQTSPEETERLKNSVSSQLSAVEQTQGEVEKRLRRKTLSTYPQTKTPSSCHCFGVCRFSCASRMENLGRLIQTRQSTWRLRTKENDIVL